MRKIPKVAYILTPITFGGSERVSLNFLKAVDRSKFDIHPILFLRSWEEEPYFAKQLRKEGFEFSVIPVITRLPRDFAGLFLSYAAMLNILQKGSFRLIHTHGYRADVLGISASILLRIPHVATCHGFISTDRKLEFYNKLDRAVLRLSDRVICVSESIMDLLVKSGVREKKIIVIPNAVSINHYRTGGEKREKIFRKNLGVKQGELVIGYAGRLSQEKGVKFLIDAFGEVLKKRPECRLWVIGDGPLRSKLQEISNNMEISGRVSFLGFQANVMDLMMEMDILVLPSMTEGTPMVLLEAMSLGIPTVASAVGQIPQIINSGENGLLISPGDTRQLTQTILKVLDDRTFARKLSDNARCTVEGCFSVSPWVRKIEGIYSDLLNSR